MIGHVRHGFCFCGYKGKRVDILNLHSWCHLMRTILWKTIMLPEHILSSASILNQHSYVLCIHNIYYLHVGCVNTVYLPSCNRKKRRKAKIVSGHGSVSNICKFNAYRQLLHTVQIFAYDKTYSNRNINHNKYMVQNIILLHHKYMHYSITHFLSENACVQFQSTMLQHQLSRSNATH